MRDAKVAAGAVANEVWSAYEGFLAKLESTSAGVGTVKWTEPIASCFRRDPSGSGKAIFVARLHLKWKARGSQVSILVDAKETLERDGKVLQSTVHLDYFDINGNEAKHLHSIHFDFGGESARHPLFHAQLCNEVRVPTKEVKRRLRFEYDPTPREGRSFRDARIPTAEMTLLSVLLCLAADHMEDAVFAEFLRHVRSIQTKLPPSPECRKLCDGISARNMRSLHWFAHME